jgi:branched-chain amino acid transport system substrate-binding protein
MMKRSSVVMGGLAALLLGAAAGAPAAAETVKIGVISTYSGPNAEPGIQIDRGLSLYVKEHAKDLPPGVKVQLVRRDDTGINPGIAKRLAQELITRDHVQFLCGVVWSPNAFAIGPIATEAKVPFVVMNASTSSLTRASPYIVRVSWTIWQKSYPLGKWAAKQGWKTAYTVVSDYAPGHDAEAAFTKAFTQAGGKVMAKERVPAKTPDFVPFLERVKDAKPDVVFNFNPGGTQATAFMKAWQTLGFKAAGINIIATDDLVTADELPNMGDAAVGVVTAGPYSLTAKRPANETFLADWKHEYGDKVVPIYASVAAWDGMAAIFDVIKETKGKFTGEQAISILSHWKTKDSPRGDIAIDPKTRDIVQNIYLRKVEKVNGRLVNVRFATIPQVKDPWKELNPPK